MQRGLRRCRLRQRSIPTVPMTRTGQRCVDHTWVNGGNRVPTSTAILSPPTVVLTSGCGLCNSIPASSRPRNASRGWSRLALSLSVCCQARRRQDPYQTTHLADHGVSVRDHESHRRCLLRKGGTVYAARCVKDARAVSNGLGPWSVPPGDVK